MLVGVFVRVVCEDGVDVEGEVFKSVGVLCVSGEEWSLDAGVEFGGGVETFFGGVTVIEGSA